MQKAAGKIKLNFGKEAPAEEMAQEKPGYDDGLMEKLGLIKEAIAADDKASALALIDECMGAKSEAGAMPAQKNGLREELSKVME